MPNEHNTDIERYLQGLMDAEEQAAFLQKVQTDEVLRKNLILYKALKKAVLTSTNISEKPSESALAFVRSLEAKQQKKRRFQWAATTLVIGIIIAIVAWHFSSKTKLSSIPKTSQQDSIKSDIDKANTEDTIKTMQTPAKIALNRDSLKWRQEALHIFQETKTYRDSVIEIIEQNIAWAIECNDRQKKCDTEGFASSIDLSLTAEYEKENLTKLPALLEIPVKTTKKERAVFLVESKKIRDLYRYQKNINLNRQKQYETWISSLQFKDC